MFGVRIRSVTQRVTSPLRRDGRDLPILRRMFRSRILEGADGAPIHLGEPDAFGSSPVRLLIYSQDGLGLGHLRRTNEIAGELLRRRPGSAVLTLQDSPLGHFFETQPGHDYVKLPSVHKLAPGSWEPVTLPLAFEEVRAIRRDMLASAVTGFRPDLVLVDHMPHGAMGELMPALDALRDAASPPKVVLGLRDIVDSPEVIIERWKVEGACQTIERYYDLVLVYGSRDVFDLAERYRLTDTVAAKIRYCGYLCTSAVARDPQGVRARYTGGGEPGKLLVAMAGGGADAYPMMRSLIEAISLLQAAERPAVIMGVGPFLPASKRVSLQRLAAGLPVRIVRSISDPLSYIEAADLVVTMAGYNTTVEILRSSTPALLVPRRGPSAEQRTRVRLFKERGWVDGVDPDDLSGVVLAERIRDGLRRGSLGAGRARPDLHGLDVAVRHLESLLAVQGPQLVVEDPSEVEELEATIA
jgi:predicted glycosyltransferase